MRRFLPGFSVNAAKESDEDKQSETKGKKLPHAFVETIGRDSKKAAAQKQEQAIYSLLISPDKALNPKTPRRREMNLF